MKLKLLDARMHGFVDFLVVGLFAAAPMLLGFQGMTAHLCYGLAGVHLLVTLLTDFPFGIAKVLSFRLHGWIELMVAPTLIALPWIFGFGNDRNAMLFFSAFGAVVFLAWVITDYDRAGRGEIKERVLRTVPRDDEQHRRSA